MRIAEIHPWNISSADAKSIQEELRDRVIIKNMVEDVRSIAGVDISYSKETRMGYASVLVFSYPDLQPLEVAGHREEIRFPYVPGLLSFREGPVILKAFERLKREPDLIMFDGQGIAHPRRFGLASHMGLILDIPSIGVAKSRLTGQHREPAPGRGSSTRLLGPHREVLGAVLRTRDGVQPIFVSIGHKVDLPTAVKHVLKCCRGHRLPEPVRQAHIFVNKMRANDSRTAVRGDSHER